MCQKLIKASPIYDFQDQPVISASCISPYEAGADDIKQNLSNEASVLILERCIVSCSQHGGE